MKHHHKKHHIKKLTSVEIALKKFLSSVNFKPKVEVISLKSASSRVLAKDIVSQIEIPSFEKAAMDGFALKSSDTKKSTKQNPVFLKIIGKIFAGNRKKNSIKIGETIGVATGSPLPAGADAVLMIEDVIQNKNTIKITKKVKNQDNLALRGEEVRKNQIILKRGTWLAPQDIGLIASIGLNKVSVFKRPSVGILATGSELTKPGTNLKKGKIFESNGIVISELVKQHGGRVQDLGICKDDKKLIEKKIRRGLQNDLLVITGGSSVGERDFVPEILSHLGNPGILVKGVSMKPGSPVTLGVIRKTPIIVCPGFPVSSFFAFFVILIVFLFCITSSIINTASAPIGKGLPVATPIVSPILIEFFFLLPANIFPTIFKKIGLCFVAFFVSDDFNAKPSIDAFSNDGISI